MHCGVCHTLSAQGPPQGPPFTSVGVGDSRHINQPLLEPEARAWGPHTAMDPGRPTEKFMGKGRVPLGAKQDTI